MYLLLFCSSIIIIIGFKDEAFFPVEEGEEPMFDELVLFDPARVIPSLAILVHNNRSCKEIMNTKLIISFVVVLSYLLLFRSSLVMY